MGIFAKSELSIDAISDDYGSYFVWKNAGMFIILWFGDIYIVANNTLVWPCSVEHWKVHTSPTSSIRTPNASGYCTLISIDGIKTWSVSSTFW